MIKILLFLILCINGSVSAQSLNIDSLAIDEYFNPWDETDGPGAAFAVMQKEKIVYSKCFGKSDLSSNSLITANTNFRIASTSKQFTAACIHLLERDDKIQLSDSIGKYLPNYPKYLHSITIDQLLHHTSGIRPFYDIGYLKGFTNYEFSEKEVFEWINMQSQLQSIPGEAYAYSNTNYWLLGKIVESISNQTLEEFSNQVIFQPLGMLETKFVRDHNRIIKNRAYGYGTFKDSLQVIEEPLETIGESGIYTNLNDLTKWVNGFYRRGFYDDSFFKKMTSKGLLNNSDTIDYASGVWVENYRGLQTISHGGTEQGFQSEMMYFPEYDITIIILCNQNDLPPTWYSWKIADILLKDHLSPIIDEANAKQSKLNDNIHISGNYIETSTFQTIEITKSDTTVNLVSSSGNKIALEQLNAEYWYSPESPIIQCKFDSINQPLSMHLTIGGAYTRHYSKYAPKTHTLNELEIFQGTYSCKELDITCTIKLENSNLCIDIYGKTYKLDSRMENSFCFDEFLITFHTKTTENKKSISFSISSERLKKLKFVKA